MASGAYVRVSIAEAVNGPAEGAVSGEVMFEKYLG